MISIITSLYHSERFLCKYLDRVLKFGNDLNKNNVEFEILAIANDPSAYEKRQLTEFENHNKYFKVWEIPLEPLYCTWNRGVGLAQYDLIGFWHVDDVRFSNAVIEAVKIFRKRGADFIHMPFIYQRNIRLGGFSIPAKFLFCNSREYDKELFATSMPFGPFFIFSKKLYEMVGPFDEQFKICGDYDWTIRASKKTTNYAKTSALGGVFLNDGESLSGSHNLRHLAENNIVFARHKIIGKEHQHNDLEKRYFIDKISYNGKFISIP